MRMTNQRTRRVPLCAAPTRHRQATQEVRA